MINFNLNVFELAKGLIPLKIRGDKFKAWVQALLEPVQTLNESFVDTVDALRYEQQFNGQVVYLEHILNDQFDPDTRAICIDDPESYIDENYIYNADEAPQTLTLYNISEGQPSLFIYTIEEVAANDDFVVYVPDTITFDAAEEVQARAVINRYKLAGKRYSFSIYTP